MKTHILLLIAIMFGCEKPAPFTDFKTMAMLQETEVVAQLPSGNVSFTGFLKPECESLPVSKAVVTLDIGELVFDLQVSGNDIRSLGPVQLTTGNHLVESVQIFDIDDNQIAFAANDRDIEGKVVHPISEWETFQVNDGEDLMISAFIFCDASNLQF